MGGAGSPPQLRLQVVEIDRLGDEIESAQFRGMASSLFVTIGGHHQDGQIRATLLDLAEQLQAVHARHVDVRETRHERALNFLASRSNTSAPEAAKCIT